MFAYNVFFYHCFLYRICSASPSKTLHLFPCTSVHRPFGIAFSFFYDHILCGTIFLSCDLSFPFPDTPFLLCYCLRRFTLPRSFAVSKPDSFLFPLFPCDLIFLFYNPLLFFSSPFLRHSSSLLPDSFPFLLVFLFARAFFFSCGPSLFTTCLFATLLLLYCSPVSYFSTLLFESLFFFLAFLFSVPQNPSNVKHENSC